MPPHQILSIPIAGKLNVAQNSRVTKIEGNMARRYKPKKADISRATTNLGSALKAYTDFVKTQSANEIFNKNARRIVKSYNQKLARAKNRGLSYLPEKQSLREIRMQFPNRKDMQNYLNQLKSFNNMGKSAFDIIETKGGGKLSRYQFSVMKSSLKDTKDFYDEQIAEAEKIFGNDPYSIAKRDYVLNLKAKREYLSRDIMSLDQSGLRTFQKYIDYSNNFERLNALGYHNFLSGVTDIMGKLDIDKETIDAIYDKISELTPAQFFKMYHDDDTIDRIYDLIPSPEHGKGIINTNDKDAKEVIDKFIANIDSIIENAKKPAMS